MSFELSKDAARWPGRERNDAIEVGDEFSCACRSFKLWYVDNDGPAINVCECGHPEIEHEAKFDGACTGILVRV